MEKLDNSKLLRNLGKKYKLVPYLDKAIANFGEEWTFEAKEKPIDYGWHPSTHCTQSVTELYEEARCPEKERTKPSLSLKKIFAVGTFWHQWLQAIMIESGLAKPEDIERHVIKVWECDIRRDMAHNLIPKDYHWVSGSADVCPWTAPDGWIGGIDFKTMGTHQFKQNGVPDWCSAKYECQMNIYMDIFDQSEWMILPIDKATGEMKEFIYERNQELIDAIYDRWKFVNECIRLDTPPDQGDEIAFDLTRLLTGPVVA